MIRTIKVQLCPNNKQRTKFFQNAGVARFAYNWALSYQKLNYDSGGKFLSDCELRRIFTELKRDPKYAWLCNYSNNIAKQAIKDACIAYKNFFSGRSNFPKFKSKKKSKPSFYIDNVNIKFTGTHVKLEKISDSRKSNRQVLNWIRLAEHDRVPVDSHYSNPRITFDGLNWWISVGIEYQDSSTTPVNDGIGIDIGVKDLAICSDGNTYKNINKSKKVRKLVKKKRRLQRRVSKKFLKNKRGERYCKTSNITKSQEQLLRVSRKLTNIRHNYMHQVTTEIVNREPKFIVLEDLNVSGMMKNRHLAKAIQEQSFYEFYRQIKYKAKWHNIELITADRYYPSSKLCSCCGSIKKDLTLRDRIYVCDVCGFTIDRDYQASINLRNYAQSDIVA